VHTLVGWRLRPAVARLVEVIAALDRAARQLALDAPGLRIDAGAPLLRPVERG
jgi:hypothetical protein